MTSEDEDLKTCPQISAVIPCLNEAPNVAAIATAVGRELEACDCSYEILFIDNGSSDQTVEIIKRLALGDRRVKLIVNNRNYGQLRSPVHAIYQANATGAVIGIAADFQDPPELIGYFVQRWRAGAKIVMGVSLSKNISFLNKSMRFLGYAFFSRFSDYPIIPNATGFGLYDREVIDTLSRWKEPEPFFRGMLVQSGYEIETIAYDRPMRAGGNSKNNLFSLISFAISGVGSSARKLLRAPLYLSIVFGILSLVMLFVVIVEIIMGMQILLAAIIFLNIAIASVTTFFLGLIGEQVRIISEIVRQTPLVVEKERVNLPPSLSVDHRTTGVR